MSTILVIDDEEDIRVLLEKLLKREGFLVFTACEGTEGVELFKNNPVDLVITDIVMPGKEGIETIMEIKKIAPAVKIIAMSGGGRQKPEGYLELARGVGAEYVFSKPFDRDDLLLAVYELLREV